MYAFSLFPFYTHPQGSVSGNGISPKSSLWSPNTIPKEPGILEEIIYFYHGQITYNMSLGPISMTASKGAVKGYKGQTKRVRH